MKAYFKDQTDKFTRFLDIVEDIKKEKVPEEMRRACQECRLAKAGILSSYRSSLADDSSRLNVMLILLIRVRDAASNNFFALL